MYFYRSDVLASAVQCTYLGLCTIFSAYRVLISIDIKKQNFPVDEPSPGSALCRKTLTAGK